MRPNKTSFGATSTVLSSRTTTQFALFYYKRERSAMKLSKLLRPEEWREVQKAGARPRQFNTVAHCVALALKRQRVPASRGLEVKPAAQLSKVANIRAKTPFWNSSYFPSLLMHFFQLLKLTIFSSNQHNHNKYIRCHLTGRLWIFTIVKMTSNFWFWRWDEFIMLKECGCMARHSFNGRKATL